MTIVVFVVMIGTAIFAIKEGQGKEKLFSLVPIGVYLFFTVFSGLMIFVTKSKDGIGPMFGLLASAMILASCFGVAARIRQAKLNKAMAEIEKGDFKTEKKFEL